MPGCWLRPASWSAQRSNGEMSWLTLRDETTAGRAPGGDDAEYCSVLQNDLVGRVSGWRLGGSFSDGLLALLVEHFKVDFRQVYWWEAGTGDGVSDVGAQVWIHDVRAADAQQWIQLFCRNVASFEDTSLLAFYQERDFVFDFGGDGDGHGRFEDTVSQWLGADVQRDFDGWGFLFQEDAWRVRLFQRQIFQVDALDLEYWLQIFVRHGTLSL